MKRERKQRLVGAIVLVALAVILYPFIFNQNGFDERMNLEIPSPPTAPGIPGYADRLDTPLSVPEEPAAFVEVPKPDDASRSRPSLDEKKLPLSWTLQLAAFASEENAEQLQSKLRKVGYRAYTRFAKKSDGKLLYRVYIGPELRREKVVEMKRTLEAQYQLKGFIVRFQP